MSTITAHQWDVFSAIPPFQPRLSDSDVTSFYRLRFQEREMPNDLAAETLCCFARHRAYLNGEEHLIWWGNGDKTPILCLSLAVVYLKQLRVYPLLINFILGETSLIPEKLLVCFRDNWNEALWRIMEMGVECDLGTPSTPYLSDFDRVKHYNLTHILPIFVDFQGYSRERRNALRQTFEAWTTLMQCKSKDHICAWCLRATIGRRKMCSGCMMSHFCGRECQKRAWKIHKLFCQGKLKVFNVCEANQIFILSQ